jgi:hypothetical protein
MSTDDREEGAPPPPLPPVAEGVDRQNDEVVWQPDGYPLVLPPGLTDEAEEANARDEGRDYDYRRAFGGLFNRDGTRINPRQVVEHQQEGVVDEGEEGEEEYPVQQLLLLRGEGAWKEKLYKHRNVSND